MDARLYDPHGLLFATRMRVELGYRCSRVPVKAKGFAELGKSDNV